MLLDQLIFSAYSFDLLLEGSVVSATWRRFRQILGLCTGLLNGPMPTSWVHGGMRVLEHSDHPMGYLLLPLPPPSAPSSSPPPSSPSSRVWALGPPSTGGVGGWGLVRFTLGFRSLFSERSSW